MEMTKSNIGSMTESQDIKETNTVSKSVTRRKCYKYGVSHPGLAEKYRAKEGTRKKCGKKGYYTHVCKSKPEEQEGGVSQENKNQVTLQVKEVLVSA